MTTFGAMAYEELEGLRKGRFESDLTTLAMPLHYGKIDLTLNSPMLLVQGNHK
jgi:hypothetical protein